MEQTYIAALEFGSSRIRGAIGSVDKEGVLTIQAVEEEPTIDTIKYGVIQNVKEVNDRIKSILLKLENKVSPRKIKAVYVAVGGRSVMATSRNVERPLPQEMEISEKLIEQLKTEVMQNGFSDRYALEAVPSTFFIDNVASVNPVGTIGRHIAATINLISCKPQLVNNIKVVVAEKQQLKINGLIVRHMAIGDLVLTSDEKELGCVLVDFGAETTGVSIYKGSVLKYFVTLPLGSRNITRDIMSLNFIEDRAEEMKKVLGNVLTSSGVNNLNYEGIDSSEINNYVQFRAGEIIANIVEQINYAGFNNEQMPCGIVIVGGGAKLNGFTTALEQQSGLKVRMGVAPTSIRIRDARVNSSDMIDVISILDTAALTTCLECMEIPASIQWNNDNDEFDDEDESDDDGHLPKKSGHKSTKGTEKSKGVSFWEKIKMKVVDIVDEEDDNEDDD